jgi:CP family cyanate transporter-like MFS transporter
LLAFSLVTALVALAWFAVNRGRVDDPVVGSGRPPRLPWDSPLAWLLAIIFFLTAVTYYGFNAWLVDAYVERGWSEESAAGLLAVTILISIPATFGFAYIADRIGSRRLYLTVGSSAGTAGLLGIVLAPDAGYGWAVLVGIWAGSIFTLIMTLPLDVAKDPAAVGAIAGMMLGLGYTLGALSPLALGAVRDATGSFTESLWVLVGTCAAVLVLGLVLSPQRLERGVRVSRELAPAPARDALG